MLNWDYYKKVGVICINALMLISLDLVAQDWMMPFQSQLVLSGNFGELRGNHFHTGIDIRTGGVEGWPVVCVKEGRLARVSVSPTGYGLALYLEHADGTTTVYAHLQRFNAALDEWVRKLQYQKENFRIDECLTSSEFYFKQGDTIAFSGNSGSSGGPHLHFEIRNTVTEHVLNPLAFYTVKDHKAPIPRKLYLYSISKNGCVGRLGEYGVKSVQKDVYQSGIISVPAGRIGVGVHLVDYMNDSWNKLGVYRMDMVVEQDTLFALQMDSCSFDQSLLVHDLKDFFYYKKQEIVYRCFGNHQNQILGIKNHESGFISINEGQVIRIKLYFADINGNRSQLQFRLQGTGKIIMNPQEILAYEQAHRLELQMWKVFLDEGALCSSIEKQIFLEKNTETGEELLVLATEETPLLKKATLQVEGTFSQQAIICEVDRNGRKWPVNTQWYSDRLEARIGYLNRYTVVEDTIAPMITYLGKLPHGILRFKIKDELSGIDFYRGEVNGEWCLFRYDAKNHLLQCDLSEPAFKKQQQNIVNIQVKDRVGNIKELSIKVSI